MRKDVRFTKRNEEVTMRKDVNLIQHRQWKQTIPGRHGRGGLKLRGHPGTSPPPPQEGSFFDDF